MAEEELNIILRALDESTGVFDKVVSSADELEEGLEDVDSVDPKIEVDDQEVEDAVIEIRCLDEEQVDGKVVPVDDEEIEEAQAEMEELDEEQVTPKEVPVDDEEITKADAELEKVKNTTIPPKEVPVDDEPIQRASAGLDSLSSKLIGVAGTIGLVDQATKLWEASTARQSQSFYLGANLGQQEAAKMQKQIQNIVASVPGDDTFMNQLMTTALAQNTQLTTKELTKMAQVSADYMAGSKMMGKQNLESQQDIYKYLLDGNTAELERGSILSSQVDKLKDKQTIEERILAVNEAMNEMGFAGISGYETASNKLEEFQGRLEKARADLGEMFLPAIQGALEFGLALDDTLGGGLMATITGLGAAIPAIVAGLSGVGQAANGIRALTEAYRALSIQETIVNALEGEGAIARVAGALGITTSAAAADGAAVSFGGLAIAEGAALWPILAIVAALAVLGVAVYEVGKYFGWWTDVGSMIQAVYAGIQRVWSAFINHPDVQAFLSLVTQAWNSLASAVGSAFNWVMSFFNNANNSSRFDLVRALIMVIGAAWGALTLPIRLVIKTVISLWTTTQTAGNKVNSVINSIVTWFRALPGRIRSAIAAIVTILPSPFNTGKGKIGKIVGDIITKVGTIVSKVDISGVTSKLVKPFTDAYNSISNTVGNIIEEAKKIPGNIAGFGATAGEIDEEPIATTTTNTNDKLEVQHDYNITLDFQNLPRDTNEETLKAILMDRGFIQAFVNNNDFQSLDAKAKNKLVLKRYRATGA